jgi:hypothetical protein
MSETKAPDDVLDRLRAVRAAAGGSLQTYPEWYTAMGPARWTILLKEAITEIESLRSLQKGYSDLMKQVYG